MDHKGDKHGYLRKCGVITKPIAVKGSSRGMGALGSAPNNAATPSKAKLEGGATKDARIKKSLKGLKGGGTEKELRDGHNSRGSMSLGGGLKMPKVAKPAYNKTTNPIRAQRQENRATMKAVKSLGGDVKAQRADNRAAMGAAKQLRHERNEMGLRKADRAAGKAARQEAKTMNRTMRKMRKGVGSLGGLAKL